MRYTSSYLLALFKWEPPTHCPLNNTVTRFCTRDNIAVSQDVLNYLNKAGHGNVVKFANYGVAETDFLRPIYILVTGGGQEKTVLPPKNLSCIGDEDRLIIIGHGNSEQLAEYTPSALASCLADWGLKKVETIYLCACEIGRGQFPHRFAAELWARGAKWGSIRAPLGAVQINAQGHKEVFSDETKAHALRKGENKVSIDPGNELVWELIMPK